MQKGRPQSKNFQFKTLKSAHGVETLGYQNIISPGQNGEICQPETGRQTGNEDQTTQVEEAATKERAARTQTDYNLRMSEVTLYFLSFDILDLYFGDLKI